MFTVYGSFDSLEQLTNQFAGDKAFSVALYLEEIEQQPPVETNIISFEEYKRIHSK